LRTLAVNADDFGFTRDVNAGIVRAHRDGILTSTTLMANGDAFEDAVRLAGEVPTLDIGAHLQMVQGPSLSVPGRALPETVTQLMLALGDWDIERELTAQVEKILAAGIRPTHLDTHKHTHLLPPVLRAVARISKRYGIRWVRKPVDLAMPAPRASVKTKLAAVVMRQMAGHFDRVLAEHGARATDHFAGFVWTGDYTAAELAELIGRLPEGITEFMCHPGELGEELRVAKTRLKQQRVNELEVLVDPQVKAAIARHGVRLVGYGELGG
jgi:chitin disaccharide deacetylase